MATYITERVWHSTQVIHERPDGGLDLELTTTGRLELVRWILSWMPEVRVIAPVDLRRRVVERMRASIDRQARASCG